MVVVTESLAVVAKGPTIPEVLEMRVSSSTSYEGCTKRVVRKKEIKRTANKEVILDLPRRDFDHVCWFVAQT